MQEIIFYKVDVSGCLLGQGLELGTTENKCRKWPERDSNPEPLDCDSMHSPLSHAASYNRLLLNTQQRNDTNITCDMALHNITL